MNKQIIELVQQHEYSCVAARETIFYQGTGLGVKPLITPMRENRQFFQGAEVADKIVGKAAAFLLVLSGAKAVYGDIMSKGAVEVLEQRGIDYCYVTLVEFIENRTGTGMCPLEQSVKEETSPEKAWDKIENTIAELMKQSK